MCARDDIPFETNCIKQQRNANCPRVVGRQTPMRPSATSAVLTCDFILAVCRGKKDKGVRRGAFLTTRYVSPPDVVRSQASRTSRAANRL